MIRIALPVKLGILLLFVSGIIASVDTPGRNSAAARVTQNGSANCLVVWEGKQQFLLGANVPWQNNGYGADFATVEGWNFHTYDHNLTEEMYQSLSSNGVNALRWLVFADGRGAPEFDANGAVTGLDSQILPGMEDAIKLAAEYQINLIFTLWDFQMLFDERFDNGVQLGGRRDVIVDTEVRQSFIDNALLPMLQYPVDGSEYTIGTHPNVMAWDIINEPEWGIMQSLSVDSSISQPVTLEQMQIFVAQVASTIHQNSNQLVTLGSASMKWNSDSALGAVGNWWADQNLIPYASDGYLDFYSPHYYGWMNGETTTWSYSPLFNDFQEAGFDKPTVIG